MSCSRSLSTIKINEALSLIKIKELMFEILVTTPISNHILLLLQYQTKFKFKIYPNFQSLLVIIHDRVRNGLQKPWTFNCFNTWCNLLFTDKQCIFPSHSNFPQEFFNLFTSCYKNIPFIFVRRFFYIQKIYNVFKRKELSWIVQNSK